MAAFEMLIFCVLLLGLILLQEMRSTDMSSSQRYFRRIVRLTIWAFLVDALSYTFVIPELKPYVWTSRIVNGVFFPLFALLSSMWVKYTLMVVGAYRGESFKKRLAFYLPTIVVAVGGILSIWTGWFFTVDEQGVYERGPLYDVYIWVLYGYMVFSMAFSLRRGLKKKYYADRQMYLSLASFGVFAMVGGLIEVYVEALPASAMGITMTFLLNSMSLQNRLISKDPLTKLNNRNQFNAYLSKCLENREKQKKLFLFMLDMDKFKQINDKFGHLEGDNALLIVADVLKRVCGPRGVFVSRFGGDEFALIGKFENESGCEQLVNDISVELSRASANFVSPLSLSIGYAAANEPDDNIPDFFKRADANLYEVKTSRRTARVA